jgi:hypothetical protein
VVTPQSLSADQKKLFAGLARSFDGSKLSQDDKSFLGKMKDTLGGGS